MLSGLKNAAYSLGSYCLPVICPPIAVDKAVQYASDQNYLTDESANRISQVAAAVFTVCFTAICRSKTSTPRSIGMGLVMGILYGAYQLYPKLSLSKDNLSNLELRTLPGNLYTRTGRTLHLMLYMNHLTSLPSNIGSFSQLMSLDMWHNGLTALPDSFGDLEQLRVLGLEENQLSTLPNSFSKLFRLRTLNLSINQFTTLPDIFSNFKKLNYLSLHDNQLTTLPESILQLPSTCEVNAHANRFSAETVALLQSRIDEIRRQDPTRGPILQISAYDASTAITIKEIDPLTVLKEWICAGGIKASTAEAKTQALIQAFNDKRKMGQWALFLEKLKKTEDYKQENRKPLMIQTINQMMDKAIKDENFRDNSIAILDKYLSNCADAVIVGYSDLETLLMISQDNITPAKLMEILIGVHRRNLVTLHAAERVKQLNMVDPLEVELLYMISLKDRLKLPFSTEGMVYGHGAQLNLVQKITDKMVQEDGQKILDATSSKEQQIEILLGQHDWVEWIKKEYNEEFEQINSAKLEEIEAIDLPTERERLAKMAQIQKEQQVETAILIRSKTTEVV